MEIEDANANAKANGWLWGRWSGLALAIIAATAIIDQAHKWWMLSVYDIAAKGRVEITPFFDLVFVKNTGVSYSMFSSDSFEGQLMLAGFAAFVSLAMWVWLARAGNSRLMAWSLGLIIGGAIGNAIDRLTLGGVADFFSLHAFGFYWYVFNIADMAIVAGVAGLLYDSIQPES
ncbi:MAG: signal peptidase II [Hyphomicrobium sp.]|nr:signal peptidase II [Hyphomicrobium sp.]